MKKYTLTSLLGILAMPVLFIATGHLAAQDLYWSVGDADWSTSASSWNTTSSAGTPDQTWPPGSGVSTIANFSGGGGNVSLTENASAGGLVFGADSYKVTGNATGRTLTLNGTGPTISVATGATATLGANLTILSDSKKITKTGAGTLDLSSAANILNTGVAADSSRFIVQDGTVNMGAGLGNTYTILSVASGASVSVNAWMGVGGLSGSGVIKRDDAVMRGITIRGRYGSNPSSDFNFGGVISGNLSIEKLNGVNEQTFSGSTANTYTGSTTIRVGTLILSKSDNIVAVSGSEISLYVSTINATLQLAANEQIANTTALVFMAGNKAVSKFDLNGHSETLGALTVNAPGVGGSNIIDYGVNLVSSILTFQSLSASGLLQVINFETGVDALRFINDPTSQLGNLTINGNSTYAVDEGSYWNVLAIPEPTPLLLLSVVGLLAFVILRPRRREGV